MSDPTNGADRLNLVTESQRHIPRFLNVSGTIRPFLSAIGAFALLSWLVVVGLFGAKLVVDSISAFGTGKGGDIPIMGDPRQYFAKPDMLWAAAIVYILCIAPTVATRWLNASATLPVAFGMGALVVLVVAFRTGSAVAFLPILAMTALVWLTGDAILRRLTPYSDAPAPAVRLPISMALGFAVIGLYLLLLASLGALNTVSVVSSGIIAAPGFFALGQRHVRESMRRLSAWRPFTPTWFETFVIAITVGLTAFALLSVFVPENQNDAYRHHLPIAREIWQTGSAPEFPPMGTSQDPIQGHLFYALALGFGGPVAPKMVQAVVGVVAIAGMAGMGLLCSGRTAAVVSAATFATIPLVLWELGHAFPDLFAVMFSTGALLCVLVWQRVERLQWLLAAGALAGSGFSTKLTMGWVIVAIAAGIFIVGSGPWRWRSRVLAVAAFGTGTLVVTPWLIRTYMLAGTLLPGLDILARKLPGILPGVNSPAPAATVSSGTGDPLIAEIGRLFSDIMQVPWQLTFHADTFPNSVTGGGDIGIVLLLLLPLVFLSPWNRRISFLGVTLIVSYLGWALSLQVVRHLLPTLSIAAVLCGVSFANLAAMVSARARLALSPVAHVALLGGFLAAALLILPAERARLPIDLIIGRETAAEYVAREIPHARLLALLDSSFPADSPVGYIGRRGGAQMYSEVRLTYLDRTSEDSLDSLIGTTPDEVLSNLRKLGISHFIWDRPETRRFDWASRLLSTDFLSRHTRIVAGDSTAYLFEIFPDEQVPWDLDNRNLLVDPRFERIRRDGSLWIMNGDLRATTGVISMRPESSLAQQVPVTGGVPYLLIASGACADQFDRMTLNLHWFDDHGSAISTEAEQVIPGTEPGQQFLWRRAPGNAASVRAELETSPTTRCEITGVVLLEMR